MQQFLESYPLVAIVALTVVIFLMRYFGLARNTITWIFIGLVVVAAIVAARMYG